MTLDLWLKDSRIPDHARGSSMNEDEKLRLWEVIHSLVDKVRHSQLIAESQMIMEARCKCRDKTGISQSLYTWPSLGPLRTQSGRKLVAEH